MKIFLTALFISLTLYCHGNAIDKLKTIDDVNAFLKSKSKDKKRSYFGEVKDDTTTRISKIKFLKIDLNNDGLTDLIVNGTYLFVVVDKGKDDFGFYFIDRGTFLLKKYVLAKIDTTQLQPQIIVKSYDEYGKYEKTKVADSYDTLIVKYDGLIEYNKHPSASDISKISFSTSVCFGTCPVFELTIQSDRSATYTAIEYNPEKGIFKGTIDTASLNQLYSLIKYLDLKSLNDSYRVNWTDDQTVKLSVQYQDGSTKSIKDYGLIGTFGLQQLYSVLFKLRSSQEWHPDDN